MKAVILAGGLGTRLSEESHLRPKPMVEVGGKPILWHIMKIYAAHGVNSFIICCGYKGYVIKEYFANYFLHMSDVTFDMKSNTMEVHHQHAEPWKVTLIDTGDTSGTGGRLRRVKHYLPADEPFCFTYGDGLSDVDVAGQIRFHRAHGKLATVCAVQPPGRYGALIRSGSGVDGFQEKPPGDGAWINGGFFVLQPKCIELIVDDSASWEDGALKVLASSGQLESWEHRGFWQPMDTLREKMFLNSSGRVAPLRGKFGAEVNFWKDKRVLITGHTGFKGNWLCWWLHSLGAEIHGLALPPPTDPSMFSILKTSEVLASNHFVDLRDATSVRNAVIACEPEVIFHLGAQPLVRQSYRDPVETYAVNVLGTVHLFEAARAIQGLKAIVNVTTDKCYDNKEWAWPYRENDRLGGADPYASSKACSELVTAAYRSSFFSEQGVCIATARAGNVIGGGDWAPDRLIPDFLRAIDKGEELIIRSPHSIRPWQHVLEPLSGYMKLARKLCEDGSFRATEVNFGPNLSDSQSVEWIVQALCEQVSGASYRVEPSSTFAESHVLRLDSSLAHSDLSWASRWRLPMALDKTMAWHRAWRSQADMREVTFRQIQEYEEQQTL